MAYALRYYKEIAQADGGVVRLEIHKKDSTTAAVEIGAVVQGLSLEIQGQQDDIDSPIQKTSLHMTFVDASDIENGQKNGFWQEFYTPDALMWKVILKAKDAKETSFRTIWGGYVTPDSFSEDLVYRGSVSITARDNIGHMQDFPFDAEGDADGMISLYNLVESGWEKIQSPMMLEWRGAADSTMWLMCDGMSAMFTLMNVSMFEGMDWYKAIETALASYGVVMRYVGNNIVKMSSLRSMPYQGEEFIEDLTHIEPTFVSGATRELIPAVKRIEERVEYDVTDSVTAPQLEPEDFTGESSSVVLSTSTGSQFTLEGWSIKNTERGEGWMNNVGNPPSYFFPEAYDLSLLADADSRDDEFMWFAFSQYATGDNRYAVYSRRMMPCAITMRLAFGSPYRLVNRVLTPVGNARADYAMIAIEVIADGVSYFLQKNGGWGNNLDLLTYNNEQVSNGELVIDIPTDGFDQSIILNVRIYEAGYYSWAQDTYIPLYSLDFSANNVVMEKNSVNTNYNAENNVILSRDPEIGPAYDRVALPAFIKNGIFYRSGNAILPAKKWSWGSGSEQQMAVFNHLQLLSYYAKPNNLISGTIVNADITRAQAIYVWHGAEHILVSGTYNFLNGHIESAVLREFARYEDMWSEVAGADLPDTEQDSRSNVEGGSASGGSSSTYSNTTTVNIGSGGGGTGASNLNDLLDVDTAGVVAQSVLYYNGTSWVDMSLNALLNPYLKADVAAKTYALKSVYEAFVASLGSLAYKNGLTASDIPDLSGIYLPRTGGTINGSLQIVNDTGAINYHNSNLNQSGWLFYGGGSNWYVTNNGWQNNFLLLHGGNYSDYVLPKTGGTITSTSHNVLRINSSYSEGGVAFSRLYIAHSDADKAFVGWDSENGTILYNNSGKYLGIKNDGTPYYYSGGGAYNTLYHTGNFNPADYLPKTGGTIENVTGTYTPLFIKTTDPESWIGFTDNVGTYYIGTYRGVPSVYKSGVGTHTILTSAGGTLTGILNMDNSLVMKGATATASRGIFFGTTAEAEKFRIRIVSNKLGINDNEILHSGNIGDYALKTYGTDIPSNIVNYVGFGKTAHSWKTKGAALSFGIDSYYAQIQVDYESGDIFTRNYNAGTFGAWKTIAFTDSNVASAQALMHSNGTVGATAYADGKVYFENGVLLKNNSSGISALDASNSYRSILALGSDNNIYFGLDTQSNQMRIYGSPIRFFIGGTDAMRINSSGNVTIGASDLASTINKCKLYVDGRVHSSRAYLFNGEYGIWRAEQFTGNIPDTGMVYNATTHAFVGGNVLIGTTTDAGYKLYVDGTARISDAVKFAHTLNVEGAVTMASTLSVADSITFKRLLTTGEYGIWRGDAFTGSLTQNDIAYNASRHAFYGNTTINGNLVVAGDISA